MTPHKHAEVLRQIADGVPLYEFEVSGNGLGHWMELKHASIIAEPDFWVVRRKPQYIMVNGFKVPRPLSLPLKDGYLYVADIGREEFYEAIQVGSIWADRAKQRGIAHATKEAAIAHAKAMLGLNPKWEE